MLLIAFACGAVYAIREGIRADRIQRDADDILESMRRAKAAADEVKATSEAAIVESYAKSTIGIESVPLDIRDKVVQRRSAMNAPR